MLLPILLLWNYKYDTTTISKTVKKCFCQEHLVFHPVSIAKKPAIIASQISICGPWESCLFLHLFFCSSDFFCIKPIWR